MKQLLFTLYFFALLSVGLSQGPMDWNVGTGGNSARNCLSTAYGPENPVLLWDESLTALRGYQTYIEGDVVVASRRFNYNNLLHGAKIVAHDLHSGDTLWTTELPIMNPDNEAFSEAKGVRNGQVYATRADGIGMPSPLYALDLMTGDIIWQSPALMTTSFSEDVAFAPNGDVIIGNYFEIIRVDRHTGEILWSVDKSTPSSDGANVAVYGGKCYCWEASPDGPVISAFKLDNGEFQYSSEAVSAGWVQQTGMFVGPDGTIYAPRTQNNPITDYFVSYTDTGSEIIENWRIPYGYAIWASSGVGPDGSVYTYNTSGQLVRLDPEDGSILNTSEVIIDSYPAGPKMAIGADGILYVANGEYDNEKLFSFNPDLSTRWMDPFSHHSIEGPSLAYDGTMVVCAGGTEMKVYQGNAIPQLFSNFEADTTAGSYPLTLHFTDQSTALYTGITSWQWDFNNDGVIDSYDQNPEFTYDTIGVFSVKLIISDGSISDTLIKQDYIEIVLPSGISELTASPLIYPNPFKDRIYIEGQSKIYGISLFDMHGTTIRQSNPQTGIISLDELSGLKPGIYMLQVTSRENTYIKRIIKAR